MLCDDGFHSSAVCPKALADGLEKCKQREALLDNSLARLLQIRQDIRTQCNMPAPALTFGRAPLLPEVASTMHNIKGR